MPEEQQVTENLSPLHLRFVEAYCACPASGATGAARKAGYKIPHRSGWENMQRDDVKQAIKERFSSQAMGIDELLQLLGDEARGVGAYVEVIEMPILDKDGYAVLKPDGTPYVEERTVTNVKKMKRDKRAGLITSIKNGPNGQSFDFVSPIAAQTLLVKIHNLAPDKVDITSKGESMAITPSAFRAAVAKKLGKQTDGTETS